MYKMRNILIALLIMVMLGTMFSIAGVSADNKSDMQLAQQSGLQYISQAGIKICSSTQAIARNISRLIKRPHSISKITPITSQIFFTQ